jgi:hypothetical protein
LPVEFSWREPQESEDVSETMAEPEPAGSGAGPAGDPLAEAVATVEGARKAAVGLKLLGGLAVRVLCPEFPPRARHGQDIDFACLGKERTQVAVFLESAGFEPDRRFNRLNGHQQMYFTSPSGRPVDVIVDRLTMCHQLDFRKSFHRQPLTLDVVDVLLSKAQIVELNEKDAHDIVHLLSRYRPGDGAEAIDRRRFAEVMGSDWGWWRTTTKNLAKLPALVAARPELVPPGARHDPLEVAAELLELADAAPKSVQWRLRAVVGERVRWYELPEEVAH